MFHGDSFNEHEANSLFSICSLGKIKAIFMPRIIVDGLPPVDSKGSAKGETKAVPAMCTHQTYRAEVDLLRY